MALESEHGRRIEKLMLHNDNGRANLGQSTKDPTSIPFVIYSVPSRPGISCRMSARRGAEREMGLLTMTREKQERRRKTKAKERVRRQLQFRAFKNIVESVKPAIESRRSFDSLLVFWLDPNADQQTK